MLSVLAAARERGDATVDDAVGVAGLLLIAGFETTVNLLGNGHAALHAHPQTWQDLVADPTTSPAVVDETLRFDPMSPSPTRSRPAAVDEGPVHAEHRRALADQPHRDRAEPGRHHEPSDDRVWKGVHAMPHSV